MVKMSKGRAEILVSYLILFGLFTISCSSGGKKRDKVEVDMNTLSQDSVAIEGIKAAKQIFYSLPSPLETAMILKRAGAKYNEEILNSVDNTSRYSTNRSMALNLGIYT